jgi:uncharacterized protein (TIGR02466 family)
MQTYNYFPSAIHRAEEPDWLSALQIGEGDWPIANGSSLVQTENLVNEENFFNFRKHLETIASSILEVDGYSVENYEIKTSSIWAQKLISPGQHLLHVHGSSVFSGFYILKTTENCAYPIFGDPRPGKQMGDLIAPLHNDIKPSTSHIHFNNLNAGSLFIFNSWLPHQFLSGAPESEVEFLHFVIIASEK